MKRSTKNDYVANLKKELNDSSSVIVTHYSGLNVQKIEVLRKTMRENGATFKVIKNTLTKLALTDTNIATITDLFSGPTAVAYSSDPVASARVAVKYGKKFKNFKIIGGAFEGTKIDEEKINFLASLLSLDEIRSKIVGLLTAPAQKIASVLQAPAGQLACLVDLRSKELEKSS